MATRCGIRAGVFAVAAAVLLCRPGGDACAQRGTAVSWTDDPRLERRITLSESRVTLEELLRTASEEAQIFLIPSSERRFWKVREVPVSVHAREVTVREFMQQIAALLDFTWSRAGEPGRWTYTIWQGANARDREARALRAKEEERLAKLRGGWDALADSLSELRKMSPSEIDRAAETDLLLRFAARDPIGRPYTEFLGAIGPAVVQSIMSGQEYRVPFDRLPPAQQQNLQDLRSGVRQLVQRMDPSGRAAEDDAEVDWSRVTVRISPVPEGVAHSGMVPGGFLGIIELTGDRRLGNMSGFPILDPTSDVARLLARAVVRVNAGEDARSVFEEMGREMGEAMRQAAEGRREEGSGTAAERDPVLEQEVELQLKDSPQDPGSALAALPEKAGLNVFAEAWRVPGAQVRTTKGRVGDILDSVTRAFQSEWELDGSHVRIRSRNWAERRAAMVPKADIQYWKQQAEEQGSLSIDDLAHIAATYSPEQLMEMMMSEPALGAHLGPLMDPRRKRALLFYGTLDERTLAALRSGDGMDPRRLSDSQARALLSVLQDSGLSPQEVMVEGARVQLIEEGSAGDGVFSLSVRYPPEGSVTVPLNSGGFRGGRRGGAR